MRHLALIILACLFAWPHAAMAEKPWTIISEQDWVNLTGDQLRSRIDIVQLRERILRDSASGDYRATVLKAMAVYRGSWGDPPNRVEAIRILRIFEKGSDLRGALILSQLLLESDTAADQSEGREILLLLHERGLTKATLFLGNAYAQGLGGVKDAKQALTFYTGCSISGDAQCMANLAYSLMNSPESLVNYTGAREWAQKAGDAGSSDGYRLLATIYDQGLGVAKDQNQATYWYKRAHDLGNVSASSEYVSRLYNGLGVTRDAKGAALIVSKLLSEIPTDKVDPKSIYIMAMLTFNGDGVMQDKFKANEYFQIAAKSGHIDAMYQFADSLETGSGIQKDVNAANIWFKRAADNGHFQAAYRLGVNLSKGNGITKSATSAVSYLSRAAPKLESFQRWDEAYWANISLAFAAAESNQPSIARSAARKFVELSSRSTDARRPAMAACDYPKIVRLTESLISLVMSKNLLERSEIKWSPESKLSRDEYVASYARAAPLARDFSEKWAADCLSEAADSFEGVGSDFGKSVELRLEASGKYKDIGDIESSRSEYLDAVRMSLLADLRPGENSRIKRFCGLFLDGQEKGLYNAMEVSLRHDFLYYKICVFQDGEK